MDRVTIMFPDLSNYKNGNDLIIIFFAILTVDVVVIFLTRYFPEIFGTTLNLWYDRFGLNAVLSDVTIILLGFVIARYLYTWFIKPKYEWNPILFMGLLVVTQVIHDVLFYFGVIAPIPQGHNQMMDIFKRYSEAGSIIIGGDAVLMIASALVAFGYQSLPAHVTTGLSILVSYALPYILYTAHK
jgi:hypothetical protein